MEIRITTDKSKINLDYVFDFLSNKSYWANGRSKDKIKASIDGSLCFVLLHNDQQIGFARVISDYVTFAYLADVFVENNYRGKGYSKNLMDYIMDHKKLQDIDRWMLLTSDAHGLYKQYGFKKTKKANWIMEYLPNEKEKKKLLTDLKNLLNL